ncbi:MAG TPA: CBS domain-containing protein, partial [Polyangiaceae bacterium]
MPDPAEPTPEPKSQSPVEARLHEALAHAGPQEAFELLESEPDAVIAAVLVRENPAIADEILWEFPEQRRGLILAAAPADYAEQWTKNHGYPEESVGRLMEPLVGVLRPQHTVHEATERLRPIVKKTLVTYGWVVDDDGVLAGVLVFRELLFAESHQPVSDLMVKNPFRLQPELTLIEAMKAALKWQLPVYPVCEASGRLIGLVRGTTLFEQQAFELSAQAGAMVGVEKEERLGTPWTRSLRFRHPWLQLNLLTAFLAATVVGVFQDTLDQLVVLAVFLPVLAGQSGNTGCQALAVALRGITLGELEPSRAKV